MVGPDGQQITCNFGRLEAKSNKAKIQSILNFNQSDFDLSQLQDLSYSEYDVKLEDIGLTVSRSTLPGDKSFKQVEDVLKPLSIILNFQRLDSKAQASADLPKYKFNAKMADVHVKISNYRIIQVLYTINSIKNKWAAISSPNS